MYMADSGINFHHCVHPKEYSVHANNSVCQGLFFRAEGLGMRLTSHVIVT